MLKIFAMFAAAFGFSIIYHVPLRSLIPASVVGGLGWIVYQVFLMLNMGPLVGCFFGACAVAILADVCSRVFKEAATVFIIPGIIPLVPGAGMYYTLDALIRSDLATVGDVGLETLLLAGTIAVALLVTGSVINILVAVKRKFIPIEERPDA